MTDDEMQEPGGEQAQPVPPATLGPMPFFVVCQPWYQRIKEATTHDAGVLLKMMVYCAEQRNGGIVQDVDAWTRKIASMRAGLGQNFAKNLTFFCRDGGALRVLPYDVERERKALETSEKQAARARDGWETRRARKEDAAADAGAMQSKSKSKEKEEDNIPLSPAVSFHNPPTPTAQPPVMDGRMETPADTAGKNLFKVGNRPASVLGSNFVVERGRSEYHLRAGEGFRG